MTLGTRNHSHIGAYHFSNEVGIHRRRNWAAMRRGTNTDRFLIQNQAKSNGKYSTPSRCVSVYDSQPASRQYPWMLSPAPQMLLLAGGHIQSRTGIASARAGTKNAAHSRLRLKTAQNAARATTVPKAWTWNAGMRPATTPAKANAFQSCRSRTASHTSKRTIRARLKPNRVDRCGTR